MSGPNSELVFPLGPLLKARFIRRDNRFRAEVELQGQPVQVHVPNSGRMKELLVPGVDVWIQPAAGANRKQPIPYCWCSRDSGLYVCMPIWPTT